MYPFKRILTPTDFSLCAEVALHQSIHLARRYRAEVHLLHVATTPKLYAGISPLNGWSAPVDQQRIDARLAGAVPNGSKGHGETERRQGVRLRRAVVQQPDPVAAIGDYVRAQAIDLVVMGTHGDRVAERFLSRGGGSLLGRTAEQVVRHAACPVLTVGLCHRRVEQVRRILVPVDGSSLSILALAYARDLAGLYDAHLALLHVIEARGARRAEGAAEGEEREAQARADLAEAFKQTKGPDVPAGFHVTAGRPEQEIRRMVQQQGVDLIVQGAHSDVGREALGVVAEAIVRSALCPVLTVRGVEERVAG